MDDYGSEVGVDRCFCGKPSEPGSEECHACRHGMLPEPWKPRLALLIKLERDTAAMLRELGMPERALVHELRAQEHGGVK